MTPEDRLALRREERRAKIILALFISISASAAGNFLLVPVASRATSEAMVFFVFAYAGVVGAQMALHAIWCVLAPLDLSKRLHGGIGVGLLLFGAWALGMGAAFSGRGMASNDLWLAIPAVAFALPLMAIAVQSPLWVARCFFRWRVFHRCDPARKSPPESLGIRDILIATGVVAVALSGARMAVVVTSAPTSESLVSLVIGALVAAVLSLLITLPLVVATLRARWLGTSLPMVLGLHYVALVMASLFLSGGGGRVPSVVLIGILALAACFLGALTTGLVIARKLGYRLYWGRRKGGRRGTAEAIRGEQREVPREERCEGALHSGESGGQADGC